MSDPHDPGGSELGPELDGTEEPSFLGAAPTVPIGRRRRGSEDGGLFGRFRRPPGDDEVVAGRRQRRRVFGLGIGSVVVILALLAFAVVPVFLSSFKKTPRDRYGISYGGGPIEGSHYQRIVAPGSTLFFNGWFDPLYLYPADQQNYIVSKVVGQGAASQPDSIVAPTSDRVQVEYQVAAYFKLNIDRLRAFHEQLGLKYNAYTSSGWNRLIQDTFRQQIESALQVETRRYTVNELVGNAQILVNIQKKVQASITSELISALGQQFFCGPTYEPKGTCGPITFVIKKIDIPTSIQNAFNLVQQRTNESKSIDIFSKALNGAGQNYVLLRAIESGSIPFWVIPEGTNLTLASPGANGAPPVAPVAPSAPATGPSSGSSTPSSGSSSGSASATTSTTTTSSASTTAPAATTTTIPNTGTAGGQG